MTIRDLTFYCIGAFFGGFVSALIDDLWRAAQ
jgi:hypothetical protein